jgi:uncharacterized protein (TIGR02145 family)
LTPVTVSGTMFNLRFRVLATGNTSVRWDVATPGNCEFADEFAEVIPNVSWVNSTITCGASGPPPCTPPSASITPAGPTTFCQGGSVVLNANTGTGLTYQWALNGANISGATNASYTANAAGSYTVVVFNAPTCSTVSAASTITVTTPPSAGTLSGTQTVCVAGTTTFTSTASGGSWTSSATGVATINASTGLVTGVSAGTATMTYTVTGTGGCANATATRTVTVTAATSAGTLSGTQTICVAGTTTFISTITGGSWTSSATGVATINASTGLVTGVSAGSATMTYTVTGTGGCANATATRTVAVTPNNTITLSSAAGSNAQTLTIGAAITNITYSTTGASGASFSGLPTGVTGTWASNTATISGIPTASGTYNYTVTMTGGCTNGTNTSTGTITVNAPAGPNIATTLGSVSGCVGDTVVVPVTINMASGISTAAISMAIGYDPTKLQCISSVTSLNSNISAGFLSNCGVFSGASQFRAAWFNLTPVAFNGVMFNVRFKILAAGTHTLAWDLATPGNCEYADELADVIPNTTWTNGSVSLAAGCATPCTPPTANITPAGSTTFCQGGSVVLNANTGTGLTYQWRNNGNNIAGATNASYTATTAGAYSVVVNNSPTCSATSAVTTVTVNNPSTAAISASICQGQTYTFGSQNLTAAGTYNRTVTAANGCDSVITLTLTVKQSATSSVTLPAPATVCGQTYTTPGTYTKICVGAAANGCDSIVTLTVTPAGPNIATSIGAVTGCIGDTVSVPVTINMASGISTAAISMAIGYDPTKLQCISSVTSLNSNISAGFLSNCGVFSGTSQFRAAWFNLTPVSFNGVMFNVRFKILAAGTHNLEWDLATPGNCEYADELADVIPNTTWTNGTVSLASGCATPCTVTASITAAGNTTFCQGGSVVLNANTGTGLTYQWLNTGNIIAGATNASYTATTAGAYSVVVNNSPTCSATSAVANVTVNNPTTSSVSASICQGQNFVCGNQNFNSAGVYTVVLQAANSCDSIITLTLYIIPNTSSNLSASICQGQTYAFGSQSLTAAGTYNRNMTAANGCDSVITLTLTVKQNATASVTLTAPATVCGQTYTTPGTYTKICAGAAANGCDSIVTLTVVPAGPNIATSIGSVSGCIGDTVSVPVTINMASGISTSAISMAIGYDPTKLQCISLVTSLNANIATGFLSNCGVFSGTSQFRAAWFNLTPVAFNGVMFNVRFRILAAGNHTLAWDLATPGNCEYADELADVIPNTTWTNGSVSLAAGCVPPCTVTASITAAGNTTFCQGGSVVLNANTGSSLTYQWRNNGNNIAGATNASYTATTSGAYSVVVNNSPTCSATSAVTTVIVNNPSTAAISASICQGQTYAFGSQNLTAAGTYNRTVTAANGCDSVITLTLTVRLNSTSVISASICQGQTYAFGSQNLTAAGTYNRIVTAANGCDSVITLTLTVRLNATASVTLTAPAAVCGQTYTTPGTYTKICIGEAANGCDSIVTLTVVPAGPSIVTSIGAVSGCIGDTVSVPVNINMASGVSIAAISMAIGYDPTKMQCISSVTSLNTNIATGFLSNCGAFSGISQFRAAWFNLIPVAFNGVMFNVRFKILAAGTHNLVWDLSTPGNCEYADELADVISNTTWNNGTVSLASGCYGPPQSYLCLPTISTLPPTSIGADSVVIGGNITNDGGSSIVLRGICYSTTPDPNMGNLRTQDGSGIGLFNTVLRGLSSSTTYYVRSYAKNSSGVVVYGNEVSFTTSAALPSLRCPGTPTVTDIDGNVYNTVQIGTQCWTQSNLKVSKYRNGDSIPTGLNNSQWEAATAGAYSVYENNLTNDSIYGKLYNHYTVIDPRGLCPTGWRVPTDGDWLALETQLGGSLQAGGALKSTLTQPVQGGWFLPNAGATNSTGFGGLPGGAAQGSFGYDLTSNSFWWSTSLSAPNLGWMMSLSYPNPYMVRNTYPRNNGFSIRCLKD